MTAFGRLLRRVQGGYMHWCDGCRESHYIAVETPLANGSQWTFNGSADSPTFAPSVRIRIPAYVEKGDPDFSNPESVCHYFLRGGTVQFCADTTHRLAGQTVALPPWPNAG